MFSLTISFGPGPTMWTLMWRDKDRAYVAYQVYAHHNTAMPTDMGILDLTDDFGQQCRLQRNVIHGVMLEDMELSKLAVIERALHQARTQAKAAEAAESDQVLRVARTRSGPAVLMPGMNGMPR